MRRALWACIGLTVAACDDLPTNTSDGGVQEFQPQGQVMACGNTGLTCPVGNICVFRDTSVTMPGTTGFFECAADPCVGRALACDCAALVCGPAAICTVAATGTVTTTGSVSNTGTTTTTGTVTATGTRQVNCRNAP